MPLHTPKQGQNSAIAQGIKSVAIGKRGSKPLSTDLIDDILVELSSNAAPPIARGAFFGALMMKGVTPEESKLENSLKPGIFNDPKALAEMLASDAPKPIIHYCQRLIQRETLDTKEAEEVGDFLFSDHPGEGARGIIASILRVRYETPDEYEGILKSIHKTIDPSFTRPAPEGAPIVQFAEPFDGVDHSNLITPLATQFVQRLNYRVISLTGRNSGPKFGNNLLDIAKSLRAHFLQNSDELSGEAPPFGWYLNQQNLSKEVDQWVERRHQIIKRPFLSTLERFINPFNARILIASAFHPPYGEKMLTICERAGYPGSVIVRNGLEGTLAFPLMRSAKVLCSARQSDGSFRRNEIIIDPEELLDKKIKKEERLDNPSLERNVELIHSYHNQGKTDYDLFDARVKVTCAGLKKALAWLEENIAG